MTNYIYRITVMEEYTVVAEDEEQAREAFDMGEAELSDSYIEDVEREDEYDG